MKHICDECLKLVGDCEVATVSPSVIYTACDCCGGPLSVENQNAVSEATVALAVMAKEATQRPPSPINCGG